jgi:diacylglycerol kinase (ATP)
MRVALIANPVSGRGRSARWARELVQTLEERRHEALLFWTTRQDEDLAAFAASLGAATPVVVIGGDGTFHQVINHLRQNPLLFLGTGTANVLTHVYRQPKRPSQVLSFLERGRPSPIPTALVDGKIRFAMMWSCGLDGAVLGTLSQSRKNRLGRLAVLLAGLACLRSYRIGQARLSLDGAPGVAGEFALVSCIDHYGGPFRVFPRRENGTGLRVLLASLPTRRAHLAFFFSIFLGSAARFSGCRIAEARQVRLESLNLPCQMDGEAYAQPARVIEVDPQPVSLILLEKGKP